MLLKLPRAGAGIPTCPALFHPAPFRLLRTSGARPQRRPLLLRSVFTRNYDTYYGTSEEKDVLDKRLRRNNAYGRDIDTIYDPRRTSIKDHRRTKKYPSHRSDDNATRGTRDTPIQGDRKTRRYRYFRNDVVAAHNPREASLKSHRQIRKYRFSTANSRVPYHLRTKSHKDDTYLWKRIGGESPASLLRRVLNGFGEDYVARATEQVARMLSHRHAIVLLQMIIRKRELRKRHPNWGILDVLPSGDERRELIGLMARWGYTRDELGHLMAIMETEERLDQARQFLERGEMKPIFLIKYILRPDGRIPDPVVLNGLIDYVGRYYTGERTFRKGDFLPNRYNTGRSQCTSLNMSCSEFSDIIKGLAMHCHLIDARLMIRISDVVAQYLRNMSTWELDSSRRFKNQCTVLNIALEAFRPPVGKLAPNTFQPFAYLWEAQKALLSLSSTFTKPAIISREGFRSIREVLSGLAKNEAEIHSSLRHAPLWPPYLRPADGIDEMMEPEEGWSRTVQAGSMMQEAGYSYHEQDHVLDVLQGKDVTGSPSIQQLVTVPPRPETSYFEASIRATRNVKEAWSLFSRHQKAGLKPGPREYAALLLKFMQRNAPQGTSLRPGDKALNFATADEPNLTEFEKARSVVPGVDKIFEQVIACGFASEGLCLRLLMQGAPSIKDMHHYLDRSATPADQVAALRSREPSHQVLRSINLPLFATYVHKLARTEGPKTARNVAKAVKLCRIRFKEHKDEDPAWLAYVWGGILRELSQHHNALLLTLAEQMDLYVTILNHIETKVHVPVSIAVQLCKNLRKTVARELLAPGKDEEMGHDSIPPHLLMLYDPWAYGDAAAREGAELSLADIRERHALECEIGSPYSSYVLVSKRISHLIKALAAEEDEQQRMLEGHLIDPISRMTARKDISRAQDAYEVMVALALVGDFEEMAWLLDHLAQQWRNPELLEAVQTRTFPPQLADFMDTFCAFRLFAEPMLSEEVIENLRFQVEECSVLTWPTDSCVKDYRESHPDPVVKRLADVLEETRRRRQTSGSGGSEAVEASAATRGKDWGREKKPAASAWY